jgi:hypothetical protein
MHGIFKTERKKKDSDMPGSSVQTSSKGTGKERKEQFFLYKKKHYRTTPSKA